MPEAVNRGPLTAEARVRCHASPCEIYGGPSDIGTGFFSVYFGFPLSYHHTNAKKSPSYTSAFYQKDKRVKPGNLQTQCSFGNRGMSDRNCPPFYQPSKG
jgi:hypothetical protein